MRWIATWAAILKHANPARRPPFRLGSAIADWLDEFFGHGQIETAPSGADALQAVEKRRPDLVLAADPMPALGGVELAAITKARGSVLPRSS
jgi:CheY-like chemotaxis protein